MTDSRSGTEQAPPRVSVIIPTYNRSKMVREAVESVLAQSYEDYEVLVVDDGSSDDTESVLAGISPRVRYIRQANTGKAAARNHALRLCRGDLIAFLDDDDLFLPDKLEKQVAYMDTHPQVEFIFSDYIKFNEHEGDLEQRPASASCTRFPEMLTETVEIATPTVMLRRSLMERAGYFDETLARMEDIDYWTRIAKLAQLVPIAEVTCRVRVHPGNNSRAFQEGIFTSKLRIMDKALASPPRPGFWGRYAIYEHIFIWTVKEWLKDEAHSPLLFRYFGRMWPYLLRKRVGLVMIGQIIARRYLPQSLLRRLRSLWR